MVTGRKYQGHGMANSDLGKERGRPVKGIMTLVKKGLNFYKPTNYDASDELEAA